MRNVKILSAGFLVGLMVSIGIPGPEGATIAKKVPIDGGNYSANGFAQKVDFAHKVSSHLASTDA